MDLSVRREQNKLSKVSGNAAIIGQHCWNNKIDAPFMSIQQARAALPGNSADSRAITA